MIIKLLQRCRWTRQLIYKLGEGRARIFIEQFKAQLSKGTILDVGTGVGNITAQLRQAGYTVVPLDVENLSFTPAITPQIYDGKHMPFDDHSFDAALVLTVLHHVADPETLLAESARVSKRLIVIEDVFTNPIHKYVTYFVDSLLNLEFIGHPHSNKSDAEWRRVFADMGLTLVKTTTMKSFLVMRHRVYILDVPA